MGMFDSFYDEDSKCPKCHGSVIGWQTKRLESLMAEWQKGDFFQYTRLEAIPEEERKRKYGDGSFGPFLRKTKTPVRKTPIILNGKVPVHTSCEKCKAWLEAYAKIVNGRFAGIVEAQATREEKELVVIPRTVKSSGPNSTVISLIFKKDVTIMNRNGREWSAHPATAPGKSWYAGDARRYSKQRLQLQYLPVRIPRFKAS